LNVRLLQLRKFSELLAGIFLLLAQGLEFTILLDQLPPLRFLGTARERCLCDEPWQSSWKHRTPTEDREVMLLSCEQLCSHSDCALPYDAAADGLSSADSYAGIRRGFGYPGFPTVGEAQRVLSGRFVGEVGPASNPLPKMEMIDGQIVDALI
jgi:hypothetical protein